MNNATQLREIVKITIETLPVMRNVLRWRADRVLLEVFRRLDAELRLQERILALALYTLSNLPDDPAERSEAITGALRSCSELAGRR